jgi:NTE family protein
MKSKLKIGIALGGGSAAGIAHIGVLRAFADHDIKIDCIAGTSAGAMIGTLAAFGVPLKEIQERAKKLSWRSLLGIPNSMFGIASNQPIEKIMEGVIGKADIADAKIELAINATDIEKGTNVIFKKGSAALAVRASACIPGLFAPVEVGDRKFVDGGIAENVPLSLLEEMHADVLIGVNVIHWHVPERKVSNLFDVMSNAIDILATHQEPAMHRRADIIIEPNLGAYSPSDFGKTDALVEEGYRAAIAKMSEIEKLISKKPKRRHRTRTGGTPWRKFRKWLTKEIS